MDCSTRTFAEFVEACPVGTIFATSFCGGGQFAHKVFCKEQRGLAVLKTENGHPVLAPYADPTKCPLSSIPVGSIAVLARLR